MTGPELVVLFADADAEGFVSVLIRRGIERGCLREFAWTPVRDPQCDAHVVRQPLVGLGPFLGDSKRRFLVLWDHHGSGSEGDDPAVVEQRVAATVERANVAADRVAAIAFVPELEATLGPAWDRVVGELAKKRSRDVEPVPYRVDDPRASLEEVAGKYQLRLGSAIFRELGGALSISALNRGDALGRVGARFRASRALRLVEWFPGPAVGASP